LGGAEGGGSPTCLCEKDVYLRKITVYSKLCAAALRGGITSESWAINQLWGLVTDLLPFRRVRGTEEGERKGERAGPGPSQCGNDSAPKSRKVTREVALRWRQGQEERGAEGGVPWHSSHGTKPDGNHTL
jgi:hypothetical protein